MNNVFIFNIGDSVKRGCLKDLQESEIEVMLRKHCSVCLCFFYILLFCFSFSAM